MLVIVPTTIVFGLALYLLTQTTTLKERREIGGSVLTVLCVLALCYVIFVPIALVIVFICNLIYDSMYEGPVELVIEPPKIIEYELQKDGWNTSPETVVLQFQGKGEFQSYGRHDYEHKWQCLDLVANRKLIDEWITEYGSISQVPEEQISDYLWQDVNSNYHSIEYINEEAGDGPSDNGFYYDGKKIPRNSVIRLKPTEGYVLRGVLDERGINETYTGIVQFKKKTKKGTK